METDLVRNKMKKLVSISIWCSLQEVYIIYLYIFFFLLENKQSMLVKHNKLQVGN